MEVKIVHTFRELSVSLTNHIDEIGNICCALGHENSIVKIVSVTVRPKYRRKGYAKKMMSELIRQLQIHYGTYTIELAAYPFATSVDDTNRPELDDLIRFYYGYGFRPIR